VHPGILHKRTLPYKYSSIDLLRRNNKTSMSGLKDWSPSDSEIAPTPAWYESHWRKGDVTWKHKLIAYGLNISRADLCILQFDLICYFSRSGEDLACISAHVKDSDIEEFEKLYNRVPKKYAWVQPSRLWSQEAILQFVRRVRVIAPTLIESSVIDRATGKLSKKGRSKYGPWMTRCSPKLEIDIDCLIKIFALTGLRPKTLQVIAKKLGFNDDDQTYLIRNRTNPTFLKELVDKPHELLMMMHDCEVLLSGSRVATYFWPGFDSSASDWDFYTHPNIYCWLRFAVYLVSIGVEWTIPENLDEEVIDIYKGTVLCGRLLRNGRYQNVQLVTHWGQSTSSIQAILSFHSSIVQNFICGFGAISMYGSLTTAGVSHVWEPREWFSSDIYQADQEAVDKYVQRGVRYVLPDQAATGHPLVPLPKQRTLADAGTICVSFHDYIQECLKDSVAESSSFQRLEREHKNKRRLDMIRNDLKLLQNVEWWEIHSRLIPCQFGEETAFWDWREELEDEWVSRQVMKHDLRSDMPQFQNLMAIISCTECDNETGSFCQSHNSMDRKYTGLCLAHWDMINYDDALESDMVFRQGPDGRRIGFDYVGYPFL
jgi:hypothetical protein